MRDLRLGCVTLAVGLVLAVPTAAASAAPSWPAYVANLNSSSVTAFNTASDSTLGTPTTTSSPWGVAIAPDGKTAYVANWASDGTVTPINLVTGAAGTPIPVGAYPERIAITPNGKTAYVVNDGESTSVDGTVTPITLETDTAGAPIPVGREPSGIAIAPNGETAYVANAESNSITPINIATNTAGSPIDIASPDAIAIAPNGTTAYATSGDGVSPINLATDAVGSPVPAGASPGAIAITPNGKTAYVVNFNGESVKPIDLATFTAGTAIPVGAYPNGIAITPNGKTAYVTNSGSDSTFYGNTVTPIDTATNTAGSPITVDSEPEGIAITPQQAPTAAFTATAAKAGSRSSFNGSRSSATNGATVAVYDWSFGDGSTASNAGATPTHAYREAGTYTVTLSVTDSAGCGPSLVFTGQTASCAGNSTATVSHQITIAATPSPPKVRITRSVISSGHHTAKLTFKLTSGKGASTQCALVKKPSGKDGKASKPSYAACSSPKTYKHLKRGHYTFYVRSRLDGESGPAASKSFAIK